MRYRSALVVFEGKKIRRVWHKREWWFSALDIVGVLTMSNDPKQYIKKMRQRDPSLDANWGTICTPLELLASDGRLRQSYCVNTEGGFRLIQSIPSAKAEPLKRWLAMVGYERVQEVESPELSQARMRDLYRAKGYSDEWIDKRIRSINVRDELVREWENRGVDPRSEFGILTAEISKATFGLSPAEYKQLKKLKHENLRDHMSDLELIFTMLGEAATVKIARRRNALGFEQNRKTARQGGTVAGVARKELEIRTKEKVVCADNFLEIHQDRKRSLER